MYETHWGLTQSPFRDGLHPDLYFDSPGHGEALARLHFLVEHGRRLGLLVGATGTGKSQLLQVLAGQLRQAGHPTVLTNLLGMDTSEFLWSLAAQLGTAPRGQEPTFRLWRRIVDRLAENRIQQLGTVILLDDADEAPQELLSYLLRIVHSDPAPEAALTVILSAAAGRESQLGPRLVDLSELRIELENWSIEETQGYLRHGLEVAGRRGEVFEPAAVERLHQLTDGNPRQVSQAAELALIAGAGQELTAIDADTVAAVFEELKHPSVGAV